jgi:hypothetical protein
MNRNLSWLRGELESLLQETDPRRPLDSLETVVVLTYLRNRQLLPSGGGEEPPRTIEGWLAWAALHSRVS